jgi:hypothetical protein
MGFLEESKSKVTIKEMVCAESHIIQRVKKINTIISLGENGGL